MRPVLVAAIKTGVLLRTVLELLDHGWSIFHLPSSSVLFDYLQAGRVTNFPIDGENVGPSLETH